MKAGAPESRVYFFMAKTVELMNEFREFNLLALDAVTKSDTSTFHGIQDIVARILYVT